MNEKDFEEFLEKEVVVAHENNKIAHMALSAIFRKFYSKFEAIRLSYKDNLDNRDENFNCYSKKIKDILTKAGKFQKNGEPISEFHIKTQMNREKTRRRKAGINDISLPLNDSDSSFKRPTTDFKGESKGKVSANSNKKVLAVKNKEVSAINNGVIEPIRIENMAKATHILKEEIRTYKKDGVIPVWNGNDEFSFIDYKAQAKKHGVEINQLLIKNVLDLRFNPDYVDYYEAWTNKAYLCEKLF